MGGENERCPTVRASSPHGVAVGILPTWQGSSPWIEVSPGSIRRLATTTADHDGGRNARPDPTHGTPGQTGARPADRRPFRGERGTSPGTQRRRRTNNPFPPLIRELALSERAVTEHG